VGGPALGLTLGAALVGWAAIRFGLARWPRVALAVQPSVTLGLVAYFAAIRPADQLLALQGWGLACWAMMRHVSFVVEARRGASTRLTDYVYYLLFFPSCFGAMETYDEFYSRNIERHERPDLGAALVGAIRGDVLVHAALVVPISQNAWLAATGFTELWGLSLLWFLRAALFLGGVWSMIEAEALLLGVRLRPNFTGILTAQTPSQFWRAWRGTMTHWLIRYVYVPLGGNQRHRTRNIFAAFVVSTVWHTGAVLFVLQPTAGAMPFVPIVTWGLLNFVGVAAHSAWRRRWPAGTWLPESSLASRAFKIALTLCFGSLTVTVLGFPSEHLSEFPRFVCALAGLARFCGR
jgi:D-alanyl-lipoteichoic acid acyltransferase DltB (MBOAT superfamily)